MLKIILVVLLGGIISLGSASASVFLRVPERNIQAILHQAPDLHPKVLHLALTAYGNARAKGMDRRGLLTIIDYSLPSYKKRLWVINMNTSKVLFYTWVAQGRKTGLVYARHFSNIPGSDESSLGLFRTGAVFYGSDGISMRLYGLERGFNTKAASRDVVMHGAWYVSSAFIKKYGRVGRSLGCTALSLSVVKPIINTVKNGTLLFSYYPDKNWLEHSVYLRKP